MSLRASLGGAVVLAGMGLARSPGMLLAFRVLQGVFTGTITANLTLVVSNTPEKRMGFAIGMMNSAVYAGDTLGPLFGGFCADLFGYRVSFLISGHQPGDLLPDHAAVRAGGVPAPHGSCRLLPACGCPLPGPPSCLSCP